ncbi:MAG: TlpA disulfide reductase family protein [Anaerolineales bacterium]|jgi:peroxiredoxin|nr:TlpA disulfide reductase family protein [Anaerolineales bacterium]
MPSKRHHARQKAKTVSSQSILMLVVGLGLMLVALAGFLAIPKAAQSIGELEEGMIVPVAVNYPAPDASLSDLDGNPVALSDYSGQVILYNAWATWCPPCKAEMPTLQAYYQKHKSKGFVIIAIEDGLQGNLDVRSFVAQYGLTFPVWPDPAFAASKAFGVTSLPTSFVIDRQGMVRLTWSGEISLAALEKYVTPLLAQE